MSELPSELARWESELAALPRELALALAPWIGRLAVAIGPWSDARGRGDGEPDGVGALSRRGSYERLLASEWLLADELPDEFLRRAASSEHLFLATVRRAPSGSRRCVALFDAGPSQLGAARIAHVALLIVLARRARDAGARFSWGVLQRSPALREDSDASAIRALLDARSGLDPTRERLDAWRDHLAAEEAHEAWAMSAAHAADDLAQRGLSVITIDDPVVIERRAIEVRIGKRRLELELPADDLGARLIRDPLRASAPRPSTGRAPREGAFGFPGDGRRLVVETADGFLSWGVPNSPRGNAGAPRRLRLGDDERLIAAGSRGRKLIAIARRGDDLVIYGGSEGRHDLSGPPDVRGRPRLVVPGAFDPGSGLYPRWYLELAQDTAPTRTRIESATVSTLADGRAILVWQSGDSLFVFERARPRLRPGVLAFCPSYGSMLIVEHRPGARVVEVAFEHEKKRERVIHSDPGVSATGAFFGDTGAIAYSVDRALADWRVLASGSGSMTHLSAPTGTKVIGVHADRTRGASLVLLESNERTISLVGRSFSAVVLKSSAPIEHAVASPRGAMVAWRTKEGWIEVGSLHHRAIVMRIAPEEGA